MGANVSSQTNVQESLRKHVAESIVKVVMSSKASAKCSNIVSFDNCKNIHNFDVDQKCKASVKANVFQSSDIQQQLKDQSQQIAAQAADKTKQALSFGLSAESQINLTKQAEKETNRMITKLKKSCDLSAALSNNVSCKDSSGLYDVRINQEAELVDAVLNCTQTDKQKAASESQSSMSQTQSEQDITKDNLMGMFIMFIVIGIVLVVGGGIYLFSGKNIMSMPIVKIVLGIVVIVIIIAIVIWIFSLFSKESYVYLETPLSYQSYRSPIWNYRRRYMPHQCDNYRFNRLKYSYFY